MMRLNETDIREKIFTVDEFKDFSSIEEKLYQQNEGFIIQNNQPTHVVMTIERYDELIQKEKHSQELGNTQGAMEALLRQVGKKMFVKYYDVFKADYQPEEALKQEGLTLASRRSRCSSARIIFRNNMQWDALNTIIVSDRMDFETISQARQLLEREREVSSDDSKTVLEGQLKPIKIGRMMQGILTELLQNERFTMEELENLCDRDYSKEMLNLNYSVLKNVPLGQNVDELKRDDNGYNRYYRSVVTVYGEDFLICSQWTEALHRKACEQWIEKKLLSVMIHMVAYLPQSSDFTVPEILFDYWPFLDTDLQYRIALAYQNYTQEKKHNFNSTSNLVKPFLQRLK